MMVDAVSLDLSVSMMTKAPLFTITDIEYNQKYKTWSI